MKVLNLAILLIALSVSAYASDANWGYNNGITYFAYSETIIRNPAPNVYSSVDVVYPKPPLTNSRTIASIFVEDRYANKAGATANVWVGGPGSNFSTITLTSQFGQGINSVVSIYVY